MKDIAFTGLEHTIFTWNIAHAGNIFEHMDQHNTCYNRLSIFQLFTKTKIYPSYRSKDGCNGATSFRASNALLFVVTSMLTWMTSRYVLSTG